MPITTTSVVPFTLGDFREPEFADFAPAPPLHLSVKWIADTFVQQLDNMRSPDNCVILPFQQVYMFEEAKRVILIGGKACCEDDRVSYARMITGKANCHSTYDEIAELPTSNEEKTIADLLTAHDKRKDGTMLLHPLKLPERLQAIRAMTYNAQPRLPLYEIPSLHLHKTLN